MTSTVSAIASIPFAEPLLEDELLPGLAGDTLTDSNESVPAARVSPQAIDESTTNASFEASLEMSESFPQQLLTLPQVEVDELEFLARSQTSIAAPDFPILASAEGEPRILRVNITTDENDGSADEGEGLSLRDAVLIANSTPDHEIIELESGKTYELSIEGVDPQGLFEDPDAALVGDLDAESTGGMLTLRTTGEAKATIDANQIHRIIQVRDDFRDNAATLIVENLILTGGKAVRDDTLDDGGGAILVDRDARLDIRDSIITGNDAGPDILGGNGEGGGIRNRGTATIAQTTFTNNTAGNGGGLFSAYTTTTVTNSTFENNIASRPRSSTNIGSGGGAIHEGSGTLEIIDSTFTGNSAGFRGGGISGGGGLSTSGGTLIVTNSTITGNTAANGGGIGTGGIEEAIIDGTTIENNSSTRNGGGIGNTSILDTITVSNSTVSSNTADADGGGFGVTGTIFIRNVNIENNVAAGDGGGINDSFATIALYSSTIANNTATDGVGGGINGGSITADSTIRDNVAAGMGGGIFSLSPGFIRNSTISGNTSAASGGGLSIGGAPDAFATFTIANSTISGNVAASSGGGLSVGGGTVTQTPDFNNEVPGADYTSEVVSFAATVVISNSTIAKNQADSDGDRVGVGGGVSNALFLVVGGPDPSQDQRTVFVPGDLTIQNSILADNAVTNPIGAGTPDISGAAKGNANNLIGNLNGLETDTTLVSEEESLGSGSDIVVFAPGLGALTDNGGSTFTHALAPGSPAIDAGDNELIWPESFPAPNGGGGTIDFDYNNDGDSDDVLPFDQRGDGNDRILNGTIDIGAFEGVDPILDPVQPPPTFEPTLEFIATTLAIASDPDSEQIPAEANVLLGGDRVSAEDVPNPAAIDYGVTEGVTLEDSAIALASFYLNGLGLGAEVLAGAAGSLLGTPDFIQAETITVPTPTSFGT